jgi:hypothetical protein
VFFGDAFATQRSGFDALPGIAWIAADRRGRTVARVWLEFDELHGEIRGLRATVENETVL